METIAQEAIGNSVKGTWLDFTLIVLYFIGILGFGSFFGRYTKSTKDFFFAGQRFSWWLIAMSMIASIVGSYSFVKYSRVAYEHGFSSTMSYMNDWFFIPIYLFLWLPVIYFSRIVSIPEYFKRRFNESVGAVATLFVLLYMIGYIGINFYTMGRAISALTGIDVFWGAVGVAVICAIYVTAGGQTAVIMTDLVQGFLLLLAGYALFGLGVKTLGGFSEFWNHLPPDHRAGLADFNMPARFNFIGVFWQDAVVQGVAAWFLNQGMIQRVLSAKNVKEGRRAIFAVVLVLQPVAAVAVANAGWLGQAMKRAGLPGLEALTAETAFVDVAYRLCIPGVFGLIMAALTAALMSTADTLINAVSAVGVNDIWRAYVRPGRSDQYYLKIARWLSIAAAMVGIALVPVFMQFRSIYQAHGFLTAGIGPPMVIVALGGLLWKRFTPQAALWTLVGGAVMIGISVVFPEMIKPFAHGTPMVGRLEAFTYMRAFYGLVMCGAIGIGVSLFTKPAPTDRMKGLVWDSVEEAKWIFKGSEPNEVPGEKVRPVVNVGKTVEQVRDVGGSEIRWHEIKLDKEAMDKMAARPGDLLFISNPGWWHGGLWATHVAAGEPTAPRGAVEVPETLLSILHVREGGTVVVEKII